MEALNIGKYRFSDLLSQAFIKILKNILKKILEEVQDR